MRGMGQTEAPPAIEAYGVDRVCDDLTGLLDHLGEESAIFAGLDFGAFAIYDLALRDPARVRAVIGLENPAAPHNPDVPPLTEYAEMARQHFVHIEYFREPGVADAALEAAPREFCARCSTRSPAPTTTSTCGNVRRAPRTSTRCGDTAPALALAERSGTRILRLGIRAQRLHRRAQLLSLDGPQVAAAQTVRGHAEPGAGLFHRQRVRLRLEGFHGPTPSS